MTEIVHYVAVLVAIVLGFSTMRVVSTCDDDVIRCNCGSSGNLTTVVIRRCLGRHGRCEPCDGLPYTRDSMCLQFRYCSTCSTARDGGCLTCPPGIYGKTCLFEHSCGEPPSLSNGFAEGADWGEGSRVTYFCETDWMLTGDSELICLNAQWSGRTPSCLRTCGPPPRLGNGTLSGATNWTEGALAVYRCDSRGAAEMPRLVCRGGQWRGDTPTCVQTHPCAAPPNIKHGQHDGTFWGEGGRVTYSCSDRYTLSGDSELVCREGRWTGATPSCTKSQTGNTCSQPPDLQNGRFVGTDWSDGGRVTYSCNGGWDLSGDTELICRKGQWSGRTPTCGKSCGQPPNLHNGFYEVGDRSEGDLVFYDCNFGWELRGDEELRCSNGRWTGVRPSCEKTCSIPLPDNARVSPVQSQYTANSQITMTCTPGFTVDGSSSSVNLTCLDTGRWNRQISGCVPDPTCSVPPRPPNGRVVLQAGQTDFKNGQKVSFTCDAGYVLSSTMEITCQDGGRWSAPFPQCTKEKTCSIPLPDNARVNPVQSQYTANTQITMTCTPGFTIDGSSISVNLTCLDTGRWNRQLSGCVPDPTCSVPPRPPNGRVVLRAGQTDFKNGQKASFTCDAGYVLSSTMEITCQDGGRWSAPFPQCNKVSVCTDPGVPHNGKRVIIPPSPLSSRIRLLRGPRVGIRSRIGNPRNTSPKPDIPSKQFKTLTKVKFSCDSTLYTLAGSAERTCQATGVWTGDQPSCVPVCGKAADAKAQTIVNGRVSQIGDWPWTAFLAFRGFRGGYFGACAGTLIGENWILTAAHCVHGRSKQSMRVYLGKHYREASKDDAFVQQLQVAEIHIHPDYNSINLDADVALLRLRGRVVITKRVSPICMSSLDTAGSRETEDLMRPGRAITIVGWGVTENSTAADVLREARIRTISNTACEQKYAQADGESSRSPTNASCSHGVTSVVDHLATKCLLIEIDVYPDVNEAFADEKNLDLIRPVNQSNTVYTGIPLQVTNYMFCAGQESGRVDACYGDSGGPAMALSGSGTTLKWKLVGIVSWGSPVDCALAGQYGGYTRVSKFFGFIKRVTRL